LRLYRNPHFLAYQDDHAQIPPPQRPVAFVSLPDDPDLDPPALLNAACTVRGLAPLGRQFWLKCPRLPAQLLHAVLADGRRARQPDGRLNETLYQIHHHGRTVQVRKPAQQGTATTVVATGGDDPAVVCDLHSHGHMPAFFSPTDDADEQGLRLYAVMGRLDSVPEMRLRLGVCGYWQPLPLTAVFSDAGPFLDLYNFKERER